MNFTVTATIPGAKKFKRVYVVTPQMNLFDFRSFIMNDLGFNLDQMVIFRSIDSKDNVAALYGLFDMGNGAMDTVSFADLYSREETLLEFCYEMRNNRILILTIAEAPADAVSKWMTLPARIEAVGANPSQFAEYKEEADYIPVAHSSSSRKSSSGDIDDDDDFDDDEDFDDDDEDDDDDDGYGSDTEEIYDGNESD